MFHVRWDSCPYINISFSFSLQKNLLLSAHSLLIISSAITVYHQLNGFILTIPTKLQQNANRTTNSNTSTEYFNNNIFNLFAFVNRLTRLIYTYDPIRESTITTTYENRQHSHEKDNNLLLVPLQIVLKKLYYLYLFP